MTDSELRDAIKKAQSAVALLVSILAKDGDQHAYREAKVAERTIEWIAARRGTPNDETVKSGATVRTDAEISELKASWLADAIFDLEDTEGFEAHRNELRIYSLEKQLEWTKARLSKLDAGLAAFRSILVGEAK